MTARHAHQPIAGTCYTEAGLPANLLLPSDYPIEAVCLHCQQPIRCEQFTARSPDSDWVLKYPVGHD